MNVGKEEGPLTPGSRSGSNAQADVTIVKPTETIAFTGRTGLRAPIKAGAEKIQVWSTEALFGRHVEKVRIDGKYEVRMVNPKKALTVQIGASLAVNVHSLLNNDLFVTPITVKEPAEKGAEVFFGSGEVTLGEGGRIDMEALKAAVKGLEEMGVYAPEGTQYIDREAEAKRLEVVADDFFWEGILTERSHRTDRLFYCPLFDQTPELEFVAKSRYKEALRHLNKCIDLDKTRIELYSKRAAVLCKLEWFDRALQGCAHHGLKSFGHAIASFKKGLLVGEIAYWDRSRVWSTGTLLRKSMHLSIKERDALSQAGKVANAQGMTWSAIAEYNEALQCFRQGVEATAKALGADHLSYATCVNNLASCQEAMGRYDEALKGYTAALRVTERASPGMLNIVVFAARHLPRTMPDGKLVNGRWFEEGVCCNPYVKIHHRLTKQMYSDEEELPTVVMTRAVLNTTQPSWRQAFKIHCESAFGQIRFSLMCQNPLQIALRAEAAAVRERKIPLQERIAQIDGILQELAAREQRINSLGKLKLHELKQLREDRAARMSEKEEVLESMRNLEEDALELLRRADEAHDMEIGSWEYDTIPLVDQLEGKADISIREWYQTLDCEGKKVRGEDFGLCAVDVEVGWEPESSEYATRLANIGNLHRIIGDTFTTRAGGQGDLKKLDTNYALAQDYLEAALKIMLKTKSVIRTNKESLISLKEALDSDYTQTGAKGSVQHIDGERTEEVCVIYENIAQLLVARSLKQVYPKGERAAQIAHFDSVQRESRKQALIVLEKAISIRRSLTGDITKEILTLLSALTTVHVMMDNWKDALPLQEKIVEIAKLVYGDGSEEWTRQMNNLNEVHKQLGTTFIRTGAHGSWTVDTQESWHWEMPSLLTRKIARAAAATHKHTKEEDVEFRNIEEIMEQDRIRLYDPPQITDYKIKSDDDPLFKLAREAAKKMEKEQQKGGNKEVRCKAVAVASKLKTPDTALVRQDTQCWPNKGIHTKSS